MLSQLWGPLLMVHHCYCSRTSTAEMVLMRDKWTARSLAKKTNVGFFLLFSPRKNPFCHLCLRWWLFLCFSPNALKPTLTMSMVLVTYFLTCSNNGSGLNFPEYYLQEDPGHPLCLPWNFIRTWRLGLTISLTHVDLE